MFTSKYNLCNWIESPLYRLAVHVKPPKLNQIIVHIPKNQELDKKYQVFE